MPPEVPARAGPTRSDPRRVLASDTLAGPLLGEGGAELPLHAAPLEHLRARDPRSRLEAAASQLHGARAGLDGAPDVGDELPRTKRPRWP